AAATSPGPRAPALREIPARQSETHYARHEKRHRARRRQHRRQDLRNAIRCRRAIQRLYARARNSKNRPHASDSRASEKHRTSPRLRSALRARYAAALPRVQFTFERDAGRRRDRAEPAAAARLEIALYASGKRRGSELRGQVATRSARVFAAAEEIQSALVN